MIFALAISHVKQSQSDFSRHSMTNHITVGGESIAYINRAGSGTGLIWLGGWRSDMHGSKAVYLDALAGRLNIPLLRFDYSGHGLSSGDWRDGTISKWVAESLAIIGQKAPQDFVLIGSSMGAWITLRVLTELQKSGNGTRVKGLILIAPAPDFAMELIEPNLTDNERHDLATKGWFEEKSEYLAEPNIWSQKFLDDGHANKVLDGIIHTHCAVHILQGLKDEDVPHTHALKLATHIPADNLTMTLVPDGDHRLSRPEDLALLERTVISILQQAKAS
jgi:pimeloyl-ACP methyl ester carboxylesterase